MKCWLVVWNRGKLHVDEFFDKVGGGKEEFSVWLQDDWSRRNDFKKGDKGVIILRERGCAPRAVYATFTVTDSPQEMKDTHPQFWKDMDPNAEKMRALVRIDSSFPPLCDIAEVLKIKANEDHWVCEQPMEIYHWVREHAKSRKDSPAGG